MSAHQAKRPFFPRMVRLLAIPIIGLYFISVGCVRLIELRRKKEDDGRDLTVV